MANTVKNHHRRNWFSWFTNREQKDPTRSAPARPAQRNLTFSLTANEPMLRGLYHGNFGGLQFASPLCFTPIYLLVQMMGYPTPRSEDERTQEAIDEIMLVMADRIPRLHRGSLIAGNAWRWPRFDTSIMAPVWEAIPDSTVSDIEIDVTTERPTAIWTHEQMALTSGGNRVSYVERKRRFEAARVDVKWVGEKPANVRDYTAGNVARMLPVNFANDADEGDIRGYSAFARIIRDLKDYHDIDYRISETIAKFRPKQVQGVKDMSAWLLNNFGSTDGASLEHLDVADNDFILNLPEELTKFEFLAEGATAAGEKALERKFWKIIEGSGIPELFWGPLATGNHASTDTQLQQAVDYAGSKRRELSSAYEALIAGTLRVLSVARMENYAPFTMGWNRLEGLSPQAKASILRSFSATAAALVGSAAMTPKQLWTLWTLNFPESDPGEYEPWLEGIAEMARHKQFTGEMYDAQLEEARAKDGDGSKDDANKDDSNEDDTE